MLPKVSLVVPIYKVEKYLPRCVDSIIKQTYSNIEVILVDDGSPDNCGKMADQYAEKDPRIQAVHKENGGLSDARNYGMQYVTGEYTLFVDSDDWLDSKMIEELVNKSLEYQADVVQSAFYYAYDDYLLFDNRYYSKNEPPIVLDNKSLMAELVINERVKNFAWGKLYRTEMIQDLPFEKGVLFEDVFWAHHVMQRVNKYVLLHEPLFYYYQRDDSIVSTYTLRNLDMIKGLKQRHRFIEKHYKDLMYESFKVILKTNLIHYNLLLLNRGKDIDGLARREIQHYIKRHYTQLKQAVTNDKPLKIELLLFSIHPYVNMLFIFIRKILRRLKIIPQPLGLERVNLPSG
jgi:glycosyltransferase involved in cell wall biosynthesis